MKHAVSVAFAVTLALAAWTCPAAADIYRYSDERGVPHYVDGIDNVPEKYRARATPIGLRNVPAPAPAPPAAPGAARPGAAPPKPTASGSATISFTPGQRIVADVRINGTTAASLVLDTGADGTLISPRALQAAGVSLTQAAGAGRIAGATGTDEVTYVVVDSLEIGEAKVSQLRVAAYDIPEGNVGDGLLGRDFLDQFNVNIDNAAGVVTLSPRQP